MADPWLKFYTSDWLGEPKLKLVSRAARSLWIDMLCLMHSAGTGRLEVKGRPMTTDELAKVLGDNPRTTRKLLAELAENGVSIVVQGSFIASSRMIEDFKKAERDKSNGRMGGNPALKTRENSEKGVNPEVKAQIPDTRSQSQKGGGGSARAEFFDQIRKGSGLNLSDHELGIAAGVWHDLGLTEAEVVDVVQRETGRAAAPPETLGYFSRPLARLVEVKKAPIKKPKAGQPPPGHQSGFGAAERAFARMKAKGLV